MVDFTQALHQNVLQQYFDKISEAPNSHDSSVSTSTSNGFEIEENPQNCKQINNINKASRKA